MLLLLVLSGLLLDRLGQLLHALLRSACLDYNIYKHISVKLGTVNTILAGQV